MFARRDLGNSGDDLRRQGSVDRRSLCEEEHGGAAGTPRYFANLSAGSHDLGATSTCTHVQFNHTWRCMDRNGKPVRPHDPLWLIHRQHQHQQHVSRSYYHLQHSPGDCRSHRRRCTLPWPSFDQLRQPDLPKPHTSTALPNVASHYCYMEPPLLLTTTGP